MSKYIETPKTLNEEFLYRIPIRRQEWLVGLTDRIWLKGFLVDVLAGSTVTLNRRRGVPVAAHVISAEYDTRANETIVTIAKGRLFDMKWKWLGVVSDTVSSLAKEETYKLLNPPLWKRILRSVGL